MKDKIFISRGYSSYSSHICPTYGKMCSDKETLKNHPDEFLFILFCGGEDVTPGLYGMKNSFSGNYQPRDYEETALFNFGVANKIPMLGICRGFQFLNVMNGGTMVQHSSNHGIAGRHIALTKEGHEISVSSTHHQMAQIPAGALLIAKAEPRLSDLYFGESKLPLDPATVVETESAIFTDTQSGGVQWHPEFQAKFETGVKYYFDVIDRVLSLPPATVNKSKAIGLVNNTFKWEL